MPELPEVETVRQVLRKNVLGKKILGVEVRCPRIVQDISLEEFVNSLVGKEIIEINRMGKYMYFVLSDDTFLISHLRMEGKYFLKDKSLEYDKHEHIIFHLNDNLDLRYADVRKFGTMDLRNKKNLLTIHPLSDLGPDATSIDVDYLFEKCQKSHMKLKALLLDQSIVAGIGNIYADEICYKAKLSPEKECKNITKEEVAMICEASASILNEAIKAGGTTIRSYTSSLGVTGLFQVNLNVHTKAGEPCPICKEIIIKKRVSGRGTYLCPNCQKL